MLEDLVGRTLPKIVIDDDCHVTRWRMVDRMLGLIPFRKELSDRKIDAVLSPYHMPCDFFFGKKYRHHLVVHDLIQYRFAEEQLGRFRYRIWLQFRKAITRNVCCFISISEQTRADLKRVEGRDSVVVYNSLPFDFTISEQAVDAIDGRPYILYVSRFQRYKNAETLIRAFASLRDAIPHLLYLKGDLHHEEDFAYLVKLVQDLRLGDRVIMDREYRSVEEMRYLYNHTSLFVHPSRMEGFGWTPIEAAVLKAPVLVSNIDVLKEVTCGKLPMFDPHDPEELAEKMLEIIKNPPSDEDREAVKNFFLDRYSLKNQIDRMTEVIVSSLTQTYGSGNWISE